MNHSKQMLYSVYLSFITALLFVVNPCCAQPGNNSKQKSKQSRCLFSNVNVVAVDIGKVLYQKDVLVEGGKIKAIYNHRARLQTKDLLVIAGNGKYLMPGLVDAHTHIVFKEELVHYLANGVTTVFSLGGPPSVLGFRDDIKKGNLVGPNIYAAAMIDAVPQNWNGIKFNKTVTSVVEVDSVMQQIKKEQWDFIKVYNSLSTAEFDEIMKLAKRNAMPVVGHGVRDPGMEHVLTQGLAMVAHAEELVYTIFKDSLDESRIPYAVSLIKKSGAFVCPNLSTFFALSKQWGDSAALIRLISEPVNLKKHLTPFTLNSWLNNNPYIHKQGSIASTYAFLQKLTYALYQANVPLVAGTDSPIIPGCFPGYSLVDDLLLLKDAGMSNAAALRTATQIPGQFIKQHTKHPKDFGLVQQGYQADLLLLDENPLEDLRNLRSIVGVMADGSWYTKNQLTHLQKNKDEVKASEAKPDNAFTGNF